MITSLHVTLSQLADIIFGVHVGWILPACGRKPRCYELNAAAIIIAVLLEALPEEQALRGYTFSSLRTRYGPDLTVFLTTAVFVIVALALGLAYSAPAAIRAGDLALLSVSPEGPELFSYVSFIVLLGILLGYARLATRQLSVWTCIGAHLMVLTVNRSAVFGSATNTGLTMITQTDTAFLLIPAYMTLALIAFSLLQPERNDIGRHTPGVYPAT